MSCIACDTNNLLPCTSKLNKRITFSAFHIDKARGENTLFTLKHAIRSKQKKHYIQFGIFLFSFNTATLPSSVAQGRISIGRGGQFTTDVDAIEICGVRPQSRQISIFICIFNIFKTSN